MKYYIRVTDENWSNLEKIFRTTGVKWIDGSEFDGGWTLSLFTSSWLLVNENKLAYSTQPPSVTYYHDYLHVTLPPDVVITEDLLTFIALGHNPFEVIEKCVG